MVDRNPPALRCCLGSFVLAAVAALLAGCAVTQPAPPALDLPAATATAADNALLEHWWTAFDDPVLTSLIDEATANNLDLAAALARIDAARAALTLAEYYLYPSAQVRAGASRTRQSAATFQASEFPALGPGNDLSLSLGASYELDLWGKYRSGALAAANDLNAARYDRETVRITVAADVASAYFRLRSLDALLGVYESTRKTRADTVGLQRDRYEAGLIGDYDLRQAEAELAAVNADIARTKQAIGQTESALATLTGRSPRAVFSPEIARGATIEAATSVPALPAGLPSGLVARRPDIRRVEAQLAASELRIQQARADYFPSINLTGAYGVESATLGSLFTGPAIAWSFGAALLQPLLNLNSIEANVAGAEARREGATVQYKQTVQNAFREVHDALVTNAAAHDVLAAETERRDRLQQALAVANLRYEAGVTGFLEVLDAQRSLLAAETLRIAAARDARLSIVDFARALGGGWNPDQFVATK